MFYSSEEITIKTNLNEKYIRHSYINVKGKKDLVFIHYENGRLINNIKGNFAKIFRLQYIIKKYHLHSLEVKGSNLVIYHCDIFNNTKSFSLK